MNLTNKKAFMLVRSLITCQQEGGIESDEDIVLFNELVQEIEDACPGTIQRYLKINGYLPNQLKIKYN